MSVWFSHFLLPNTTIDQTFHLAAQPRRPIHVAAPHWPSPLALVGQTLKPTQPTNSRTCSASRSTRAHHSIPSKCKKKKKIQIGGEPAMSRGGGGGGVEGAGAGEAAMAPNSKAQRLVRAVRRSPPLAFALSPIPAIFSGVVTSLDSRRIRPSSKRTVRLWVSLWLLVWSVGSISISCCVFLFRRLNP